MFMFQPRLFLLLLLSWKSIDISHGFVRNLPPRLAPLQIRALEPSVMKSSRGTSIQNLDSALQDTVSDAFGVNSTTSLPPIENATVELMEEIEIDPIKAKMGAPSVEKVVETFSRSAEEQERLPVTKKEAPSVEKVIETFSRSAEQQERLLVTKKEELIRGIQDQFFLLVAVLPSLLAFLSWEQVSKALAIFLDVYGAVGRAVDGGQFTNNLLRPTITGIVVPVTGIALATLVSTTVNVLRERQVELRALINKEACELRLLRRAVFGMFGTKQHASRRAKAMALISGYVAQLEDECTPGAFDTLEKIQLTGGIAVNELDKLSEMLHGVDGAAASRQGSVAMADGLIISLNGHRSERIARLLSVFPVIHWGVLFALSVSIIFAFLLESNQPLLQYLSSIQLRMLFAILVGVLSGTATLCLILVDPFRGSFSITEAATQLGDIRLSLKQDVVEACKEEGEITSKAVHRLLTAGETNGMRKTLEGTESILGVQVSKELKERLDAEDSGTKSPENGKPRKRKFDNNTRRRYGFAPTIYFHLLTGPFASNARVLGDVIAWVASFVSKCARSASSRIAVVSSKFKRPFRRNKRDQDSLNSTEPAPQQP